MLVENLEELKGMISGFALTLVKNNSQQKGQEMMLDIFEIFSEIEKDDWAIIEENEGKVTFDVFGLNQLPDNFDKMEELKG